MKNRMCEWLFFYRRGNIFVEWERCWIKKHGFNIQHPKLNICYFTVDSGSPSLSTNQDSNFLKTPLF